MNKKGISAVVATILIILIVVIGVGIVWKVILPLFAELEFLSYSDVKLNIVFQGYTIYDFDENFAFVQIQRGADNVNVTGLEIGFNFDGTTKTYQTTVVPEPGGKHVYKFNFTNDSIYGIPQGVAPKKVTVAPIFVYNNKIRLGKILDEKPMPSGKIHLSSEEWINANLEAAENIVVIHLGPSNEPGTPVNDIGDEVKCVGGEVEYNGGCAIEIDNCGVLNRVGAVYILNKSIDEKFNENCFNIVSDDIILDGNGYSVNLDENYHAIYVNGRDNITIKNFNYLHARSGWYGGGCGIYFENTNNSLISNISDLAGMAGLSLSNSNKNKILYISNVGGWSGIIADSGSSFNNLSYINITFYFPYFGIAINGDYNFVSEIIATSRQGEAGIRLIGSHNILRNVKVYSTMRGISNGYYSTSGGINNSIYGSYLCSNSKYDVSCSENTLAGEGNTCSLVDDSCSGFVCDFPCP